MFSATRASRRNAPPLSRLLCLISAVAVATLLGPGTDSALALTTTVPVSADTYVSASYPNTNYGASTSVWMAGSTRTGYLRFTPQSLSGRVTKATLRVYSSTSSSSGFAVHPVADTSWNERTVTYANRPAVSSTVLSQSGSFSGGRWLSLDVTSAVTGNGALSLALVTPSSQIQVCSREAGSARTPTLAIDTASVADTSAPTAPTALQASPGNGQVALSWTAATDNVGVSGYRVYQDGALIASPAGTSYTISGLVNGTTHSYMVKAVDAAGNLSAGSNQVSATPAAPVSAFGAVRPYDPLSPWNTPIGSNPTLDPSSGRYIAAISDNGLPLTSDPDQYAIPIYYFNDQTPRVTMKLSGYFSSYDNGDNSRVGYGYAPTISNVPVPSAATQSAGSDGQIVFWDPATGTEYAFWQFAKDASGNYTATNGWRYHTTSGYYGRFADGLAGRGAGTPYDAGLVRKWEIDQGRIDHALAFAYNSPSSAFVYPASKSDGGNFGGVLGTDLPEGTRLQLDPSLTDATFDAWGLSPAAKVIARALQTYGMYTIDHSGSSKIYLEDRKTAGWDASIDRHLTEKIPWSSFRVVGPPVPTLGGAIAGAG